MTRPLVRTRARRYRFIRLASSGSAASLSVDWNQIKRQTRFAPLPQPTPARRGWSALYLPEAGKPAAGWGGVGGGGRSKDMIDMSAKDEVWAKGDRTIVPPQRRLARTMRAAPTEAERRLWWHLRHRIPTPGTHFRRQVRIGRYIADFACHATRIVIEVDGGQHGQRSAADEQRTKVLEASGYRVLRYWNNDVLSNIDSVLDDILSAITTTPPPPTPPHKGEGGTPSAWQLFCGDPQGEGLPS